MKAELIKFIELILYSSMGFICFSLSFTSLREIVGGRLLEGFFFLDILAITGLLIHTQKIKFDLSLAPIFFIILIVGPLTLLNSFQDFPGSNLATLFALVLASGTGYVIAQSSTQSMVYCAAGISIASLIVIAPLISSGFTFSEFIRFSAFSDNPNQLALYTLSAMTVIALFLNNQIVKIIFLLIFLLLGATAISDAFYLAIIVCLVSFMISKAIFSKTFLVLGLPFLIISIILFFLWMNILYDFNILASFFEFWSAADQGGTRVNLYLNGMEALSYSPLLGHGAGAFSGVSVPFSKFEAHNTFIDFATMGGLVLPLIFYAPLIVGYLYLIKQNPLANAALAAFIVFTLFHFIGRHPIVWVVWGSCVHIWLLKGKNMFPKDIQSTT